MILGVSGACRREELYNITLKDIELKDEVIIVNLPNTKTKIQRTFTVVNNADEKIPYLQIIRKYINLRPKNQKTDRLFLQFRNGKCINQVVGKGTIGGLPCKIASYLGLSNPKNFTGHSFRRTSATLLANTGVDVIALKRHGGWRSSTVAESYVEDSLQNKIDFAQKILHNSNNTSVSINTEQAVNTEKAEISGIVGGITLNNLNNCTVNFNINKQ